MVFCPAIVAQTKAGRPEVVIRGDLERKVLNGLGEGLRILAKRARFREATRVPKMVAHVDRDPPEPSLIAERFRQSLAVANMLEASFYLPEGEERSCKVEVGIDSLLQGLAGLRQMRQSCQRLLEVGHRLGVGRSR